MKKKFEAIAEKVTELYIKGTCKAKSIIEDESGSSIVDIAVGVLVSVGVGAIVIAIVNAWTPNFVQSVLDRITSDLGL